MLCWIVDGHRCRSLVDGHPCRTFWRKFLFDFIGHMLITYVNNADHVNYVNNIYNKIINKLHLTLSNRTSDCYDETCLFYLKSFIHCLSLFFMTFWSCRKKDSIRKMRLISKSMRSQPRKKKQLQHTCSPICQEVKIR